MSMNKISWKTRRKAYWLFKNGKVKKEIESPKRIHFTILNDTEDKQVMYDKNKDSWSCDCRYYALKLKDCSHILASKLFMEEEENAG
ncbi:MAG: hypothetical protein GF368_06035 [Candidatus Aenigmarchaeota archaeon]|nr:hypothetical protein [Candidatus Aenigmarchaeota archaeon]